MKSVFANKLGSVLPIALLLVATSWFSMLQLTPAAAALDSSQTPLQILVPLKLGFNEFVSWSGTPPDVSFSGFSVEVFRQCVQLLPFSFDYEFVPYGNGSFDPDYNGMVQQIVDKKADGVVADITITVDRIRLVDFTQPYIQSTLVMVVPFRYGSSGQIWDFLQPFSKRLWASIITLFCSTGLIIFIVEHKNDHFHTGLGWRMRLANVYWFTFMTVFFSQREDISTKLGRILVVFWLFVVLILTSSYTASLASILAAQAPYPSIQRFEDLLYGNRLVGYQDGSFTGNYLKTIGFRADRLEALTATQSYSTALQLGPFKTGGVAAILDELPYMQVFLNSECQYTMVGNQIAYFGGFGFAFQKNSTLTDALSTAILALEQDGELQRIRDSWLGNGGQCSTNSAGAQIPLQNVGGLFIIVAVVYFLCALWRFAEWGKQHARKRGAVIPVEGVELSPAVVEGALGESGRRLQGEAGSEGNDMQGTAGERAGREHEERAAEAGYPGERARERSSDRAFAGNQESHTIETSHRI